MTVEIISFSISSKVWHWVRIDLVTPGSAVQYAKSYLYSCFIPLSNERNLCSNLEIHVVFEHEFKLENT